jgi:hypothetical protein
MIILRMTSVMSPARNAYIRASGSSLLDSSLVSSTTSPSSDPEVSEASSSDPSPIVSS